MMKWQPIDTAPKDGSYVLLFYPEFPVENFPSVCTVGYFTHDQSFRNGRLTSESHRWRLLGGSLVPSPAGPTHWMPLPDPPVGFV